MRALTLDIIVQVIFGVTEQRRIAELTAALRKLVDQGMLGVLLEALPPQLRRVPPFRGFVEATQRVDELLYGEIAERRVADCAGRSDLLSRLTTAPVTGGDIGFTDIELRDQLMALLLAGHDTTSSALAWTFHELAHNEPLQDRVIAAVDAGDDEFVDAVVKETLRRHTIITATARKVTKDITIDGYRIPKGFTLSPALVVLHRNNAHYKDPLAFQPERFLGTSLDSSTWMPFGGGVRRCIGAALSMMESTIILKEVFSRYRIAPDYPVREHPPIPRNLSLVPSRGTRVIITPRVAESISRV